MEVSPRAVVERLPWECYVLRGALETDAQGALVDRVGALAGDAFESWPARARAQDHPIIIASHAAGGRGERPRECRRACGIERCHGHCGRDVGALRTRPDDIFALANALASRIAAASPASSSSSSSSSSSNRTFDASHFWALVYGDRSDRRDANCGKMQSHLDRPVGWTLSISVGRPVRFNFGRPPAEDGQYAAYAPGAATPGQAAPGIDVVLRGGDAALFRGHAVFHAVDGFADEDEDAEEDAGEVEEVDAEDSGSVVSPGRARVAAAPGDWATRLLAAATRRGGEGDDEGDARDGWVPARLALLFRDDEDAAR